VTTRKRRLSRRPFRVSITAFTLIAAEAQKCLPDQANAIQDCLAAGQNEFTNGDYSTVLDSAKESTGKVKDLLNALSADFARVTSKPAVVRRERREKGWPPEKFAGDQVTKPSWRGISICQPCVCSDTYSRPRTPPKL
jgi:hypothetical protein